MPELDVIREQIAYLKFWQGVMVITDISIIGWLVTSADHAGGFTVFLAVLGVAAITLGIVLLHRHIEKAIESLREL